MNRETIIKTMSHAREWLIQDILGRFKSFDQMILIINEWIRIASPWVLFCDVITCEGMWIHCVRSSTGMNSKNWNECEKCGTFCSVHTKCTHSYRERGIRVQKDNQKSTTNTSTDVVIDGSINILTRDVLSIVLKHLIVVERTEIDKRVPLFRTLKQALFALEFALSEGDSVLLLCDNCEAFIMCDWTTEEFARHNCESICEYKVDEGEYSSYCQNCKTKVI